MRTNSAAILVLALLNAGCATIMNGRNQEVGIGTTPAGADCKIGSLTVKTPSVATLRRNTGHTVYCELAGYHPAGSALASSMSGWVWGDVLLGGLIGLAIDFGTGAAYKLRPEAVQLTLQHVSGNFPAPAVSGAAPAAAQVVISTATVTPVATQSLSERLSETRAGTMVKFVLKSTQVVEATLSSYDKSYGIVWLTGSSTGVRSLRLGEIADFFTAL